ncbi:MAG: F0F1 ATP synthase subunit epsilon [Clostridia bacterium]|nr:F0F1 ATP synthase subunit epsilon [Clostridia bacterium]
MKTYHLTVSTPDGNVFSGQCTELLVKGTEGELVVMAGHIPFVTSLVPSRCTLWLEDGTEKAATVDGGVLTVGKDSVTLIAGSFKFTEE